MDKAASELDVEGWIRISRAEMDGKIFQRPRTFLCKARDGAQVVEHGLKSQEDRVQTSSGTNCFFPWLPAIFCVSMNMIHTHSHIYNMYMYFYSYRYLYTHTHTYRHMYICIHTYLSMSPYILDQPLSIFEYISHSSISSMEM